MRKGKNKIVKILFLVACVVLSTFAITALAGNMKSATNNEYVAKSQPYTGSQAKAYINATENADRIPTLTDDNAADYLFAGWYVEDTFNTPIKAAAEITSDSANVYAKFVPKAVLGVKAQIKTNLYDNVVETKDENTEFRFITSIDSPNYKEVGIEVTYKKSNGEEVTKTNSDKTKVYENLYVVGTNAGEYTDEEGKPVVPSDVFCNMSRYFKGYTLTEVPGAKYGTEFSAKAYWTTLDGTKIYGDSVAKCIEDGCIRSEVWVADTTATNKADGILGAQDRCYYGSQAYPYTSLDYALKMSNKSKNNVVIHMESDNSLTKTIYVQNANGKNITVDGGNYTLKTVAAQNAVCVYQTAGTATFQNMNISHPDGNMIFRVGESSDAYKSSNTLGFNLKNVKIDADTDYRWALISFLGYQTYNANMEKVEIYWNTTTTAESYGGVIRNAGNASERTLNLTMTDCTVDASGAIARKGLELAETTDKGTVKLVGTTSIKTENAYPIYTHGLTVERAATTTLESTNAFYDAQPVQDILNGVAKVNGQGWKTFSEAFAAAHKAATDATESSGKSQTITLLQDCALGFNATGGQDNVTTSEEGFKLTIEGNGKKITTAQTGSKIALSANNAGVTIKNADVVHNSTDRLIQATDKYTGTNITLDSVDIVADIKGATETTYQYGVIHFRASGTFTMKDSTLTVSTGDTALKEEAAIRVGGGGDNNTVAITVTGSTINTTGAKNMADIIVRKTTTADITVTDSTLNTQNVAPIRIDGTVNAFNHDNTTWSCQDNSATKIYGLMTNGALAEAKIGNTYYKTLGNAVEAANTSTSDVTITLCRDIDNLGETKINNTNGKTVTIDGANKNITTKTNTNIFQVQQTTGTVNFQNMKIVHNGAMAFRIGETSYTSGTLNLNFTNVNIDANTDYANGGLIQFMGCLTYNVIMDNMDVDWDTNNTAQMAIIRDGGGTSVATINLTMKNGCMLDASGADNKCGIQLTNNSKVTGTIALGDTTISTKNHYPIYTRGFEITRDGTETLTSTNAYYNAQPIYDSANKMARIGTTSYGSLKDALVEANGSSGAVTITLLQDCALGFNSSNGNDNYALNKENLNLTIDGQGHTITTGGPTDQIKLALEASNLSLTIKDAKIVHNSKERFIQVKEGKTNCNFALENVEMTANGGTEANAYYSGLINFKASGAMTLKDTTIDMNIASSTNNDGKSGIIRTGNANEENVVKLNVTGCTLDTTDAANRPSIYVTSGTTADITLATSTLKTDNCEPIQNDGTTYLTCDDATRDNWKCDSASIKNLYTGTVKEKAAEMNGTPYASYTDAFSDAKSVGGQTTIKLFKNITVSPTNVEKEGWELTIDGNGHTITTSGTSGVIFALNKNNVKFTLKNATVVHDYQERFIQAYSGFTGCAITLDTVNVNMNNVSTSQEYQVALVNFTTSATLTMNDTHITATKNVTAPANASIIRVGGGNETITVNVNMTNSSIDVSKVANVSAIRINNKNTGIVTLNGTTLHTNNMAPIFVNSTGNSDTTLNGALELTMTGTTWTRDYDSSGNAYDNTTGNVYNTVDPETRNIIEHFANRIALISDVHYLPSETKAEYDAAHSGESAPDASGDIFGYTMAEKMAIIQSDINGLNATKAVDSLLVLGDLSTDDEGYRNFSPNYVQKFKTDVMDKFTAFPSYALAGNHDSYSNDVWKSIFNTDRQFSVEIKGAAFIMIDTYNSEAATSAEGSPLGTINTAWLKTEVAKYRGKPIFLCVHYMDENTTNAELKQILTDNPNIVCIFRGHTHYNGVYTCKNLNNIKMIDVSGYAYRGDTDYRTFDENCAWGYGVLEWTDNNAYYYHVKNARTYKSQTSSTSAVDTINYAGAIENETRLIFNLNSNK